VFPSAVYDLPAQAAISMHTPTSTFIKAAVSPTSSSVSVGPGAINSTSCIDREFEGSAYVVTLSGVGAICNVTAMMPMARPSPTSLRTIYQPQLYTGYPREMGRLQWMLSRVRLCVGSGRYASLLLHKATQRAGGSEYIEHDLRDGTLVWWRRKNSAGLY
jgi:hypothetical protein